MELHWEGDVWRGCTEGHVGSCGCGRVIEWVKMHIGVVLWVGAATGATWWVGVMHRMVRLQRKKTPKVREFEFREREAGRSLRVILTEENIWNG